MKPVGGSSTDHKVIERRVKVQPSHIRSEFCQKLSWFMMGVGFLFPYNSVVTAVDFFAAIYFPSIDFALGWLLLAPSLLILCITLKFGYRGSICQRIIGTLLISSALTVAIPLVRSSWTVYFCTFALGCSSAVLQGTLFSLLGFLGSDLMAVTQTGIGCSGVLVGIVRIATKYFVPQHLLFSTYLYFGIAFVMVLVDTVVYLVVLHPSKRVQDAVRLDALKNEALHRKSSILSPSRRTMHRHEGSGMLKDGRKRSRYDSMSHSPASGEHKTSTRGNGNGDGDAFNSAHSDCGGDPMSLSALFCASWRCQIAVFLNYSLTLSLFPGVMSLMIWDDRNDGWFAVIQILIFNLFDTMGKKLTTYPWILGTWSPCGLLVTSVCRLGFVPLFVLCIKPLWFPWKLAIVINAAMGFTNGLVGTSGFCLGPSSPKLPPHEQGRTAQMLAVALTAGLAVGASSAFLIQYVMDDVL